MLTTMQLKTLLLQSVFVVLVSSILCSATIITNPVCDFCGSPRAACFMRQADVAVLFHSSAVTGEKAFNDMKSFTNNLFDTYALGECSVRAAMVRYGDEVESLFDFQSNSNSDDIYTIIDALTQEESNDPRIVPALEFVRDNTFSAGMGSRPDVPRILVVITDNLFNESGISAASEALKENGVIIVAVGVGENVDPVLLTDLAEDVSREFLVPDAADLIGSFQPLVQSAACYDVDECQEDNGGCNDTCINTLGSFFCHCTDGLVLSSDRRTCVDPVMESSNETDNTSCLNDNGGCCQICVPTTEGRNCSCSDGYALNSDGVSCSDIDECFSRPCSYRCTNTIGSFFCECKEDDQLSDDLRTCVPRPGPADCPANFKTVSHSCMTATNGSLTYAEAEVNCANMNDSRLAKVADEGTRALVTRFYPGMTWIGLKKVEGEWINSDDTPFTFKWAYGEPRVGDCGYVQNEIFSASCNDTQGGACEIPRTQGFVIYGRRWPLGTQGKMYLATDVNEVMVTFPRSVSRFQVWYGTITRRISARQYIVTQGNIERQSYDGHVGFILFFRSCVFPADEVLVEPYME